MSAFGEEDAAFFFGREKFVDGLVQATYEQPLVAVIGPSGSGKSSVMFAGLIPKLTQQGGYLLEEGCSFIREYFKTNPPDDQSDQHMCDDVRARSH